MIFLELVALSCIAYIGFSELCRNYFGEPRDAYWIPHRGAFIVASHALGGPLGAAFGGGFRAECAQRAPVDFARHARRWTLSELAKARAAPESARSPPKADAICAICLDSLAERDAKSAPSAALAEIRRCGHVFCEPCIARWLSFNRTCPLCAQDVTELLLDTDYDASANADAGGARLEWVMLHQC